MISFGTGGAGQAVGSSSDSAKRSFSKSASTSKKTSPRKLDLEPVVAGGPSTSTSPTRKWKPGKKHNKSLSAKALEASKRSRTDSQPSTSPASPVPQNDRRWTPSGKGPGATTPPAEIFELADTSPRGQSNTRPKHIPIVIPQYAGVEIEALENRSGSLSTFLSTSSSDSPSVTSDSAPSFEPKAKLSITDKAKPRHVEIQIPSWAQPVLKQSHSPPRLAFRISTFVDPFSDVTSLSPPDMARPAPDLSRTNTMDSSTSASANHIYAAQQNQGSRQHLPSANSSHSSLTGLRAEYESASEAESGLEDQDSHTPSQHTHRSPADGGTSVQTAPNGTNTANLSGLVCNVHRTTGKEPHPLVGATTTILGDKLYVFGGRRLSRTKPQLTASLYELDLICRHWTRLNVKGDIPAPRYFHSVCTLGDTKLVCYGGMSPAPTTEVTPEGHPEVVVMSDIHIFDVNTRTWTKVNTAESPQGRYAHCATILPSSAVFASGNAPLSAIHHNPSGQDPNQGTIGVNIDGAGGAEMIVVGGQDSANHYIEQVSVFNLRSLKWTGTTGMGRSCGAYRSVVTPLTSMRSSQIGLGLYPPVEDDDDESLDAVGSGAPMLIYSNYNFLDVKLELQIRLPDGTLTEKPMQSGVSPPGLRFPNGGVIDNHFVVSGTFLTSSKQEYALWALDLRTLIWSRIDAGGSIFSQGSWNRGILWNRRNSFVILGNRKRSLVDDYNNRRINFSNVCVVELEAFGLYDNPRKVEPTSAYTSASASLPRAHAELSTCGRQLSPAAEELGTLSMTVRELADMDFLAIDGTRIPVSSRVIARRWGEHFTTLLRESLVSAVETDTATLRPNMAGHPSRNSSVTITPSLTSAISNATTLTSNGASELPDTRSAPPSTRPRLFYLPHTAPTLLALLHYLYTSTLPAPPSALATPQILCSLLQLARPYRVDGLLEAVLQRLHECLDGRNAAALFNAAAMAAGGGEGIRFASGLTGSRDGMIPLRGTSLTSHDSSSINGLSRHAASLRINTEMANGRSTRTTMRAADENDEDQDVPDSAATDTSMSESEASLSSRSIGGRGRDQDVWNGALSAVVGLQKRGLRGLMEGRRIRDRERPDGIDAGGRVGLGIAG
ncbi:hypothetical protein LTR62_005304 [Meristemomyces frigidus]|uniref:BTB domain-containing protein n=1 Tax=Meristemomyces frigidus TaxID=1508187 RepID=A0AAN7YFF7_9PEZI|nr:hypothetical protein LTR62_005304 [Meristemomyces frigidus]